MSLRNIIICIRCKKQKLHFGLQMCSACLRRTKRETRPEFYLNTVYSELSRRVKYFDEARPEYFGLNKCSKYEFMDKFLNNNDFLILYKNWQLSNFQRKDSPTIDRIDNQLGYTIDNIRFISHFINTGKNKRMPIVFVNILNEQDKLYFCSQTEAAKQFNVKQPTIWYSINHNKIFKGCKIYAL